MSTMLKPIDVELADLTVKTVTGDPVRLGDVVDRPTILVLPRYYGCLPCRGYLRDVSQRLDEIEALGGSALAISKGADYQARWLAEHKGIRFPLFVDPDRQVLEALDLRRKWWIVLNPKGLWNYLKALLRGNRQGLIIEPIQAPGLVLLDVDATAIRIHRGRALGDYPPLTQVLEELRRITQRSDSHRS